MSHRADQFREFYVEALNLVKYLHFKGRILTPRNIRISIQICSLYFGNLIILRNTFLYFKNVIFLPNTFFRFENLTLFQTLFCILRVLSFFQAEFCVLRVLHFSMHIFTFWEYRHSSKHIFTFWKSYHSCEHIFAFWEFIILPNIFLHSETPIFFQPYFCILKSSHSSNIIIIY